MALGNDGLNHSLTTIFSARRDNMGVIDIGLYSNKLEGFDFLGTGVTTAFFHCFGTVPVANERLKMLVTTPANSKEHLLKIQHGRIIKAGRCMQ